MKIDQFKKGQRVRVVHSLICNGEEFLGREFKVDRVESTHGFVVVGCCESDEPRCAAPTHGKWWFYPNALDVIS